MWKLKRFVMLFKKPDFKDASALTLHPKSTASFDRHYRNSDDRDSQQLTLHGNGGSFSDGHEELTDLAETPCESGKKRMFASIRQKAEKELLFE
jgi:hypothetical protein